MSTLDLRRELEQLPLRMTRLPVHRGYPVPWFVEWLDEDGKSVPIGSGVPDFRIMSSARLGLAVTQGRCWVCGDRMGRHVAYVSGPMCGINRTSAEPPSHRDCAEWSARNCPFLARPHARRREAGLPPAPPPPGIMLKRNPGVSLVWVTNRPVRHFRAPDGGVLFDIGDPEEVSWWAEGRPATHDEIMESVITGLPELQKLAEEEGPRAVRALENQIMQFMKIVPD